MPKKPSPKKSANEEEDSSKNSMSPNSNRPQLPHKEATINNDMNALDKISEIDEIDSRPVSRLSSSKLQTSRPPDQTSKATFRPMSTKRREDDEESDYVDTSKNNGVLLTELDEHDYDAFDFDFFNNDTKTRAKNHNLLHEILSSQKLDENEQEYDTDLEDEKEKPTKKAEKPVSTPRSVYKKMCDELKVVPCRYFLGHIENKKLVLRYRQFSPEEIRAFSKPLWTNYNVEKLFLDGNWIEETGIKYISRMIRQNDFINELSLADNRLGETPNSVNELCAMLETNCILKKLNLSGNVLGDREIAMLLNSVDKTKMLKSLDLSHNNFTDDSASIIAQFISSNDQLEVLNISWNKFQMKGAREIANGVRENVMLKECNLSFNGFDVEGGKALSEVIRQNNTLESLNISNTRLNSSVAGMIANALQTNDTLKRLYMANNPISSSGALAVLYASHLNSTKSLQVLDLSEIPVTKDFADALKDMKEERPNFKCAHGPFMTIKTAKSVGHDGSSKIDFEKILRELKTK